MSQEQQTTAIRKLISAAAPGRLPEVCKCIHVVAGGDEEASSSSSAIDDAVRTFAVEYVVSKQTPVRLRSTDQSGSAGNAVIITSPYNHLQTLVDNTPETEVRQIEDDIARRLKLDISGYTEEQRTLFLSEFFLVQNGSDEEPRLVWVDTIAGTVRESMPLRTIDSLITNAAFQFTTLEELSTIQMGLQDAANDVLLPTLHESAVATAAVFYDGSATNVTATDATNSSSFVVAVSAERVHPSGTWSGRWTSHYYLTMDRSTGAVTVDSEKSKITFDVQCSEDGNIQLQTSHTPVVDLGDRALLGEDSAFDASAARSIMRAIRRVESAFSEKLETKMTGVADGKPFKSLRRRLPVSKQLFDFTMATNNAAAVAASSLAAASENGN